ncbi:MULTISPECIES: pyrroline-5-carboxylate reductase dimerization domain-containing protein [unclassified Streptomyces]|uniref:pyrroline-5-carboxylate reductase family protein n=1 Tax=unclassified Streptomyces TaxID=2593676 RepID=UPI0034351EE8
MTVPPMAFVGCGRIARAMVSGLLRAGRPAATLVGVSRTGAGARALSEEFGIRAAADPADAVRGAGVVVLAVHPHETADALARLAGLVGGDQLLLSLVASWRTEAVAAALPGVPVVRAVPNVAVALGAGATVLSPGPGADGAWLDLARQVCAPLGDVTLVEEARLETVSALSGAGPALVSAFAQALTEAAVAQGLAPHTAAALAAQAVAGTGALLAAPGATPASVMDAVASPGGMTQAALNTLDELGLSQTAAHALESAVHVSLARMATA